MADSSIERAFSLDYGIEAIIQQDSDDPALPEDRARMRPIKEAAAAGIDVLLHFETIEKRILDSVPPLFSEGDWVYPLPFRQGLIDIMKRLRAAGGRDDTWAQAIDLLEANDRLLELMYVYQNTLRKV